MWKLYFTPFSLLLRPLEPLRPLLSKHRLKKARNGFSGKWHFTIAINSIYYGVLSIGQVQLDRTWPVGLAISLYFNLIDDIFETGAYRVPSKSQNPTVLGQGGLSTTQCSNPSWACHWHHWFGPINYPPFRHITKNQVFIPALDF